MDDQTQQAVVVVITAKKIQSYVFSSNRLREHIGASYLIKQATTEWVDTALEPKSNKVWTYQNLMELPTAKKIEELKEEPLLGEKDYKAIVISTGGGQIRLLMEAEFAKGFIQRYTRKVLEHAPGLPIYVGVSEPFWFDPTSNDLGTYVQQASRDTKAAERTSLHSQPQLGLGVTAKCSSTGLPASQVITKPAPDVVSCEIYTKHTAVLDPKNAHARPADEDLLRYLDIDNRTGYQMPLDFDDFGRSEGDQSYVAVVHIDGNNMGQRAQAYFKNTDVATAETAPAPDNCTFIARSRHFSRSIEDAVKRALKAVYAAALTDAQTGIWTNYRGDVIELKAAKMIPLRFLIVGGDDITFVCDGRLGLGLAELCINELSAETNPIADKKPLHACAGISIVKTHYPFARAYELAEELCSSAKKLTRTHDGSALDWHIAASGLSGNLETIRKREYTLVTPQKNLAKTYCEYDAHAGEQHLFMRPVLIKQGQAKHAYQYWATVKQLTLSFAGDYDHPADPEQAWGGKRNKVMQLRESLRGGEHAVKQFTAYYGRLPQATTIPKQHPARSTGWADHVCLYFDPIELIDFYWPIVEEQQP